MADKGARTVISVSTSWDDRAIIQAESDRTGDNLSVTMMRLAMLGLERQALTAGGMTGVQATLGDGSMPLLTAGSGAGSAPVTAAPGSNEIIPAAIRQPVPEPALTEPTSCFLRQSGPYRWAGPAAASIAPFGHKARWTVVGVLSLLLALMLVPGNGMIAAAVSQTVLGQPGDGIAASNQLFEHFSHRPGPQRYLEATARLVDNRVRMRACADLADHLADYRDLTPCELHVPSRRRAVEVGQGIVD